MSLAPSWSLVVHGGCGDLRRDTIDAATEARARDGLRAALAAGEAVLARGGAALDAVEAAVCVLEDDPAFNAGRGAVFTYEGGIELDAAVMDGATRAAGAVAGITRTRHPVRLARAVMAASPHVLLSREGADRFSVEQGLEQADPDWFATPERREQLDKVRARGEDWYDRDVKYGTVGAVACDVHGHVAAATSTGGLTGKRWGRIGDTPIIGGGTYADDRSCAVSATGAGEFFIRGALAHEVGARMRLAGESVDAALAAAFADLGALGGTGGMIVATPDGGARWRFSTPGMYRARAGSGIERQIAIFGDEG
jgi:beta-aspartyl-peptidase (threonine type)